MCSMCWFGAELSWPLRTNAEAANEGCSSFYTVSTLLHWGRIHTVLFYKKQYWRNQHWKYNLEQEATIEYIQCCIEDSFPQFKIIRNDQEKVSDASISGIFSSYPLLFEPPCLLTFKKISSLFVFSPTQIKSFPSSPLLLEPPLILDT